MMTDYYTSDGLPVLVEDLPGLDRDTQIDVMEMWFRTRYEDPAQHTPYDSGEGGYIWIWGGPHEARDVLGGEFGELIDQEVIDSLADDLDSECLMWASTTRSDDYDVTGVDYHSNFVNALRNLRNLIDGPVEDYIASYLYGLLYVNVVTALETYLSDAFINTVLEDRKLLRRLIETAPEFKKTKLSVSEVFKKLDDIDETAKTHLGQIVWHNLARVERMYREVLDISFPNVELISQGIKIRHDLVHRNGKTREGEAILIDKDSVLKLAREVEQLVQEIDGVLLSRQETNPLAILEVGLSSDDLQLMR